MAISIDHPILHSSLDVMSRFSGMKLCGLSYIHLSTDSSGGHHQEICYQSGTTYVLGAAVKEGRVLSAII